MNLKGFYVKDFKDAIAFCNALAECNVIGDCTFLFFSRGS
ncbi:hypothetical protein A45J_1585 [hot springs metagenome]|uniref:Uncharacterized protein n=1 Tax=hot springs metagenome TaxID=433727 RepID=A0A5J4L6P2_9ZZZZ